MLDCRGNTHTSDVFVDDDDDTRTGQLQLEETHLGNTQFEEFTMEVAYAAETLLKLANNNHVSSQNCAKSNLISDNYDYGDIYTSLKSLMCSTKCLKSVKEATRNPGYGGKVVCGLSSNSYNARNDDQTRKMSNRWRQKIDPVSPVYLGDTVRKRMREAESEEQEKSVCDGMRLGSADEGGLRLRSSRVSSLRKHDSSSVIISSTRKNLPFSVIHLLSAVRLALVYPRHDRGLFSSDGYLGKENRMRGILSSNNCLNVEDQDEFSKCFYLSVDEIVQQVNTKPGDPRILETKAPLADLVRGCLRIFSSETPPLGAKGWKPLAAYDKSYKGWHWIGPIPRFELHQVDTVKACTANFWGFPENMMVKLVDSFADWLITDQFALKQRASLAPPPLALDLCKLNPKERWTALRTKGCSPTIKPCIADIRAYFRSEERLRYMTPERAFAYTVIDGTKSSVAPLRKCGDKLALRARDNSLLKPDRPGSVTLLTIVRDAAARLPGRIGSRGDVAVLVRDSQYLVEGIPDEQLSQVVSGGLDRLHYERDPCVKFDRQKRLWTYMHGEPEEEDFDDQGRQSTIIRWPSKHK